MITALSYLVAHIHTLTVAENVSDTLANTAPAPTTAAGGSEDMSTTAAELRDENDDYEAQDQDENATVTSTVTGITAAAAGTTGSTPEDEMNEQEKKVKNIKQLLRVRDSIVSILIERTHDKSHFTRASVLKAWGSLLEQNAVPVRHITAICELAYDRLIDKTAIVRKNAVALLTSILDNNPFGGELELSYYVQLKQKMEVAVLERIDEIRSNNPGQVQAQLDAESEEAADDEEAMSANSNPAAGEKSKKHGMKKKLKVKAIKKNTLSVILEEYEEDDDDEDDNDEEDDVNTDLSSEQKSEMKRLKAQMRSDMYQQFIASEDVQNDEDFIGKSMMVCICICISIHIE